MTLPDAPVAQPSITPRLDYVADTSLLLHQFQLEDVSQLQKLVEVFAKSIQDLDGVLFELVDETSLLGSVGIQLDNLGTILAEPRLGASDDEYRQRLGVCISVNRSNGRVEEILDILSRLITIQTGTLVGIHYESSTPAYYMLHILGAVPNIQQIIQTHRKIKPAGVGALLYYPLTTTPFRFLGGAGLPRGFNFGELSSVSS